MVALDEKIESFYQETEQSVNCIIEGSDEHLDLILGFTKSFDMLSGKFEDLNEYLFVTLNKYSDEELLAALPKMKQLNKSCVTLIGSVRTCFLYRDVRTSFKNYTKQYDVFRELLHDIQNVRLAKDDDFDSLLKDLNSM